MEFLAVGDKIQIRRSNGCVQSAKVGSANIERQIVTVEWTEGNKVKGKDMLWSAVLELNPSLAKKKENIMNTEKVKFEMKPQCYNMYRKKSANSSLNKRLPTSGRSDVVVPPPTVKQVKPPPDLPITNRSLLPTNRSGSASVVPRSSVVREVERLKEKRELRRALQDKQRLELRALKSKDPNNPNWEVALMVRIYRDQLQLNPLRSLSPQGAQVQQITVCVRKRPLSRRELQQKGVDIISVPNRDSLIVHELRHKVDLTKFLEHHKYRFDYTFDEHCSNTLVYEHTAQPLIRTMFEGGNATCFAYGQTGSGKTHTMGGEFCGKAQDCTTGIYGFAAKDVFAELHKPQYRKLGATVTCSYFEIYGTKVFDLLEAEKPMRIVLENGYQQVVIVNLTQVTVTKVEEVLALIEKGNRARTSGQTSVNAKSSRSHAVFQMALYMPGHCEPCGKCSFVDLAGNERGADTQTANRQTRREGAEINKSLLALKECIRALSRHSSHLPFRGSKLTQVLRDSFIGGEQNKTCMIAMISPSLNSVENTLNTLRYANRVKELVAKDEDVVETDTGMRPAEEEQNYERDDEVEEIIDSKDTTESESGQSVRSEGLQDYASQSSEYNSFINNFDNNLDICEVDNDEKTDPLDLQLTNVIMQHDMLFEFFHNFKQSFEKIATGTPSTNNMSLTKFLQESETTLHELEGIVKHTYNLVSNYNSQQSFESGGENQAEENIEM